jgi:flagellar export protein FliJ
MKRFVWRLERVLKIKTIEEQKRRAELFALTERLSQSRGELLTQEMILKEIISDIAGKSPQKRLGEQEFFLKCSAASDELIKKLKQKVKELELLHKKKIEEVLEARKSKEGLEKLREQAKKEYIREQEKLEQKEMDEGSTVSFARQIMHKDKVGEPSG